MAELATIARPYAEALFKAGGPDAPARAGDQLDALARSPAHELRQFADNPKVESAQVYDVHHAVAQGVA
jgi:F-type H+-transporting ATPase subunit delta